MKKSLVRSRRSTISLKWTTLRSASSRGETPSRSATCATGSPCSSVPVRKKTSSPRWRMWRASDVGGDRRVRVAEVRLGVDVVDRGRDVEAQGRGTIEVGGIERARGRISSYNLKTFEPRPKDRGSALLKGSQPQLRRDSWPSHGKTISRPLVSAGCSRGLSPGCSSWPSACWRSPPRLLVTSRDRPEHGLRPRERRRKEGFLAQGGVGEGIG